MEPSVTLERNGGETFVSIGGNPFENGVLSVYSPRWPGQLGNGRFR